MDRVLAELAAAQHGVVARRQLLELGIGRGAIAVRLERGSLQILHRGVYAVGHRAISREGRWMAAVLACGPDAVLSHRSAAAAWGLLSVAGRLPEVTRPRTFRGRSGIRSYRAAVPEDERGTVAGIPVTSVPRTIADLAAVGTRWQVGRALHEAEVMQLHDRLSVPDLLRRYPRRNGSALLREALGDARAAGATANDFEEEFAAALERHGVPRPRFNPQLVVAGRHFSPDCLWSDEKLIVELDGRGVHGTRRAFESDRERDRVLTAAGWRVVRITWRQLRGDPDAVVVDLRRALRLTRTALDRA